MKAALTLLTALLLAPPAALHAADNPLPSAQAVWCMTADEAAQRQPFALKENGTVKFGPLGVAEAVESRKRGSADEAVKLTTDAFLSLDSERATQLRLFDPAGAWFYKGSYHVFSYHNIYARLAYNSLDHYLSDDLLSWTQWPIGPWADSPNDIYGIWLNNHFLDDAGVPTAIYSAVGEKGNRRAKSQPVRMRAFVDKQVVEAFVNGQTCTTIAQVKDPKTVQPVLADGLDLFSEGGNARCTKLDVWKMNPPVHK